MFIIHIAVAALFLEAALADATNATVSAPYYVRGTRKRPRTALSTPTSKSPPLGYVFIVSVYECSRKFTPG